MCKSKTFFLRLICSWHPSVVCETNTRRNKIRYQISRFLKNWSSAFIRHFEYCLHYKVFKTQLYFAPNFYLFLGLINSEKCKSHYLITSWRNFNLLFLILKCNLTVLLFWEWILWNIHAGSNKIWQYCLKGRKLDEAIYTFY